MEPDHDEARTVAAARGGSEAAWRTLIEAHQDRLVRLAWALTGDRHTAADVAQEALVEAFVRIRQLRDDARFGAWVRTILVRAARRRRRPAREAVVERSDPRTPEQEAVGRELRRAVDEAIRALAPVCREALALAMDGHLNSREAAELLGCSREAYRTRLHRARQELRRRLAEFLEE